MTIPDGALQIFMNVCMVGGGGLIFIGAVKAQLSNISTRLDRIENLLFKHIKFGDD